MRSDLFDSVNWDRSTLPDGTLVVTLRSDPLPLATKDEVLEGVAYLDGEGTVILPAPSRVAQGDLYGPGGSLEGTLAHDGGVNDPDLTRLYRVGSLVYVAGGFFKTATAAKVATPVG